MVLRLVLVEDHQLVREGLRALLAANRDIEVAAEATTGAEGIRLAKLVRPDVAVVDLTLPDMSGFEVIREVSGGPNRPRVVILSMHTNEAYVLEALRFGALGYVPKQATASDLTRAVHEVAAGRRYFGPPLSERKITAYARRSQTSADNKPYTILTQREREILRLVATGRSGPEISKLLSISCRTVESHRAAIMRKAGLRRQTDLVRYAVATGLVPQAAAPALHADADLTQ